MKNGAEIEISDYRTVMETDITGEHLNSILFNRVRSRQPCLPAEHRDQSRGSFPSFPITGTPSFCVIDID